MTGRFPLGRILVLLSLLALAAAVAYVVVSAISAEIYLLGDGEATLLGVVLALALVAGLVGALLVRRELAGREELERRAREQERQAEESRAEAERAARERDEARADAQREQQRREQELGQAKERLEQEVGARDRKLAEERQVRAHLARLREAERDYARQLRGELLQLHSDQGPLADTTDTVPELVLRLAMTMLEAPKGILLRRPADEGTRDRTRTARARGERYGAIGEEGLELAAARGFDGDPAHSELARRFASRVIERDTTVREDAPDEDGEADREIDSLVAIPIYLADEFSGVVVCANRPDGFEQYDDELLLSIGDHAGALLENQEMRSELRGAYVATVSLLAEALDAKDPFLRGHSDEVAGYVAVVAERMEIEPRRREALLFASLLHDVGKIGISERILLKPTALSPEEYSIVQLHPRIGCRLIEQVPALREMAPVLLHHHERWDGAGYPAGLKGEQIPLEARIVGVADSFSAMTAERPYRGRMSFDDACAELERCAGTQFDPQVVKVFVEALREAPPALADGPLEEALDDPEIQVRRDGGEPLLGFGAFAVTDSLTLLYSHTYFHEVAAAEGARAEIQDRPFAVVLAEVANIAELNRTGGFPAGDGAIRTLARALHRAAVRSGGTACRHGGARLGLLAPGTDEAGAGRIAAELAAAVDAESDLQVRVGAAAWRRGERAEQVIARARTQLGAAGPAHPPAA